MKPLTLATLFLLASALLTPASADTDPLRGFSRQAVKNARQLELALSGTTWVYHYQGEDFPLQFGASGKVEKLQWWPTVYWRIIGPSEVLLEDSSDGKLMVLRFNDATTKFECKDWAGPLASGSLNAEN